MKKTICMLLSAIFLLGLMSACGNKTAQPQKKNPATPTGEVFVENVFPEDTGTQNSNPTTPTEGQQPPATGQQTPSTQPTQGQQTPSTEPTQRPSTEPTQRPSTEPTQGQQTPTTTAPQKPEQPTGPSDEPSETDKLAAEYEAYTKMTAAQKTQFRNSFENTDAFFAWYNSAFAAYKAANPPTQIGPDGNINLG